VNFFGIFDDPRDRRIRELELQVAALKTRFAYRQGYEDALVDMESGTSVLFENRDDTPAWLKRMQANRLRGKQ
jgi:hypothetical protein